MVSAASGRQYVDKTLHTEELNTWAPSLALIEYSVNLMCSKVNFGRIWRTLFSICIKKSAIWFQSRNIPPFYM